jgi:acyl-CoA thioester hydrolase
MPYADFRHRMALRVRWAEVDKQGVVFNANYLLYADVCVTEYWRAVGMRYPDDFAPLNTDLYVRRATLDYRAAAYYDDELEVCGRSARIGNSSINFVVEIYRRRQYEAVLVVVDLVYVHVDATARTPLRVADALREKVRAFETVAPEERVGSESAAG